MPVSHAAGPGHDLHVEHSWKQASSSQGARGATGAAAVPHCQLECGEVTPCDPGLDSRIQWLSPTPLEVRLVSVLSGGMKVVQVGAPFHFGRLYGARS